MSGKSNNSARFIRKTTIAITALLKCRTLEEASQVADIPTSTLRRWRTKPEFLTQLHQAQTEILSGVTNELRSAGLDAAATLRNILKDAKAPAQARVRAAGLVLNLLLHNHENEVLEFRMSKIEAALKAWNGAPRNG